MARTKQKQPEKRECGCCGTEQPVNEIRGCPRCGADKCNRCDMGDDVECGNCPSEEDGEEL